MDWWGSESRRFLDIRVHWAGEASDTRSMPSELNSCESERIDHQADGLGEADARFDGDSVLGELERVGEVLGGLGAGFDVGLGDGVDSAGAGAVARARMFAHEVNNLVGSISGRAQRAMMSGEPAHRDEALLMASDLGARVGVLSEFFMECGMEDGGDYTNRPIGLLRSYLIDSHVFARSVVESHRLMVGGGGVGFVLDVEEGAGVCVPGVLMGQVLVNLYGNALDGIGRGRASGEGDLRGRIRLGWRRLGGDDGGCGGEGVVVRVEDSGVGFGGDVKSVGGHGLGLGVCRGIVEGFGGRVVVGESKDLGGGMVSLFFTRTPPCEGVCLAEA